MKATVHTTAKVSKVKGVSVGVAVLDLPTGSETFNVTHSPPRPSPNSAAMEALALGVGMALARGADEVEAYSSSKNAVKAVDGSRGADFPTRLDAHLAAWVIYWKADRLKVSSFAYRAGKEMPDAVAAAEAALKRAGTSLAASEPLTLPTF